MGQKFQFNPQRYGRNKDNWRIRIGSYPNGSPKYFPCDNEEHAKREQRKRLTLQANNDVLGLEALKVSNAHDVAPV
tara:strand:- start:628 stop:855 length:228 start_codon:yes stop_codon:yes gene_type:complete